MSISYNSDFQRALALGDLLDLISVEQRDYDRYRNEMRQIFSDCAFDFVSAVLRRSPTHEVEEILLRLPLSLQAKALPVIASRLRYLEVFERTVPRKNLLATLAVLKSMQPSLASLIERITGENKFPSKRAA